MLNGIKIRTLAGVVAFSRRPNPVYFLPLPLAKTPLLATNQAGETVGVAQHMMKWLDNPA